MKQNGRPWTPHEDATLLAMREAGENCGAVADKLNRTAAGVWSRYSALTRSKEEAEAKKARRRQQATADPARKALVDYRVTVPDEVIEERNRRLMAPKTLTGWLQGDPPAGFSSLERRT